MKRLSKPILAILLIATLLLSTAVVSLAGEWDDPIGKCISIYRFKDMK